jgi:divalent metal cation (Fe/Co/Zn/Cd) transporter
MGKGISEETEKTIISNVNKGSSVDAFHQYIFYLSVTREVLVLLIVSFRQHLQTIEINETVERLKKAINDKFERANLYHCSAAGKGKNSGRLLFLIRRCEYGMIFNQV